MAEANKTLIFPLETPSSDEHERFHQTVDKYQYCRDRASEYCWQNPNRPDNIVTSKRAVEDALYHDLREETNGLHANLVQKAITDVTSAMDSVKKAWKRGERISKPTWETTESWVMTYDTRAGTFSKHDATFATTGSTVTLDYQTPSSLDETQYEKYVLSSEWELTTSKLAYRHGQYWLHLGVKRDVSDQHWTAQADREVSNAPTEDTSRVRGVDLNVTGWTAVTTAGGFHGNADSLTHRRTQCEQLRGELQRTGTRSAYLRLQERSGTESAWVDEYAHLVSNSIIMDALETCSTHIAFEKLDGIRERMSNLPKYQQWMFGRVQEYVEYRAVELGITVVYVNPKNTSKGCSHTECQAVRDSNRQGKQLECVRCGRSWNADSNAARKIGLRYIFDSLLPASQPSSLGKANCQLALVSGVLSVTERDASHVSTDWMSTDKPTASAVGS